MRFRCTSTFHPKPYEPSDYIRPNVIEVVCRTAGDEDAIAARLAVDYLDIANAERDGASVLHVCDADSSGWTGVYEATIEPAVNFAKIREDFGFDDPINGLLFLYSAVFHPDLSDWQRFVIDSVCSMFPEDTAMVMWKWTTQLSDKELASLGFRIVAGSDLLFRPNMLPREYSAAEDGRDPIDLEVAEDAGDYVDQQWDTNEDF